VSLYWGRALSRLIIGRPDLSCHTEGISPLAALIRCAIVTSGTSSGSQLFIWVRALKDVKVPLQLWRASDDDQVPDAWNAAVIRQELPKIPKEHEVNGAGHYAFLPPCSEALARQVPQICTDDPGFDRKSFHRDFDGVVIGFFQKALIPHRGVSDFRP